MTLRISSGSSRSVRAVDPVTSAKTTVTTLSAASASGGAVATTAGGEGTSTGVGVVAVWSGRGLATGRTFGAERGGAARLEASLNPCPQARQNCAREGLSSPQTEQDTMSNWPQARQN